MDQNFDISVQELSDLLAGSESINLIDVRNPDEYEDDNLGGLLFPLGDLPDSLDQLEQFKSQDIYVHCRSGARSAKAKEFLLSQGFEKVHNVKGGILEFRAAGL